MSDNRRYHSFNFTDQDVDTRMSSAGLSHGNAVQVLKREEMENLITIARDPGVGTTDKIQAITDVLEHLVSRL